MPRTALTPLTPKKSYDTPIVAEDLDFTWDAGDNTNGNDFALTGDEIILVKNNDAGAQTITFTSVALNGRTADITTYSVGIGEYAVFYPHKIPGWIQADGKFYIDCSVATVLFKIIKVNK